MKKAAYSIAVLLAACACSKEDSSTIKPEHLDGITFSATMDEAETLSDTKVQLGNGNTILWTEGDSISILDVNSSPANSKFDLASGAGTTTASFPGSCPVSTVGYYAVYPYSSNSYIDKITSNPDLWWNGSTQSACDGQIDPSKHMMVAYAKASGTSSELSLAFKNVISYLKFTINYSCKSVVIQAGSSDDYIACNHFEVSMDSEGNPILGAVTGRSGSITLTSADGDVIEPGTYYVGILPKEYSQGFSMTFTSSDSDERSFTKSSEKSCTFARSKIYNLGTIDIISIASLEGDGTEESPYLIRCYNDLKTMNYLVNNNVGNYASAYYRQENDIDCNRQSITPTGNSTTAFSGNYDGQSHTITNLTYGESLYGDWKIYSLFGFIKNATIRNLDISYPRFSISDEEYHHRTISPLVGYALSDGGTNQISGCHVSNGSSTISISQVHDVYYGGIVAFNESDIVISNCSSTIDVRINCKYGNWDSALPLDDGYRQFVGGILGYTSGQKTSDPVRSQATDKAYTFVNSCRNTGKISIEYVLGMSYVGGIIGMCEDSEDDGDVCPRIGSCVNSGDMSIPGSYTSYTGLRTVSNDNIFMGGIVGYMNSDGFSDSTPLLAGCLFKGTITTGIYWYKIGGIVSTVMDDSTKFIACVNAGHDDCATEDGALGLIQYAIAHILSCDDDYSTTSCYSKESWVTSSYCTVTSDLTAETMNGLIEGVTWTGNMSDGSLDIVF